MKGNQDALGRVLAMLLAVAVLLGAVAGSVHADGKREILLAVPHYNFDWQLQYRFKDPVLMERGSRVVVTFHYDNSPNNAANPDAAKAIRWGDRSEDEMMTSWIE